MSTDPNKITFFARTDARGKNVQFGIKAKDRQRHVYVIGKTGMGKSTLLENMAVQDIQNGEGMAFIDPHGSAAETLLNYIPEDRINDVVYFAPFDMENPISFNIMEDVGADKRHLVVSGLMSVFKKIWVDAWSARMEYILSNTLLALLEYPDSTLLSVNRMLADKDYRKKVVDNVKDPSVKSFWVDEFAKYTDRFAAEATPAIQNKIGQFTSNPVIRNIVGQPKSSFDIRKMMDEKKILIMNLSKGLIGETNANLLGSMLTTRIYLAAMSRADLSPEKMKAMPNFYFYVDEFQSFANATFANILSEARKYHLNLTIAHQYIEQMEEEVRDAVFGNVGTTIAFRVGPLDAEFLEAVFTPQFLATDLVNLGFAQIYLSLMIDGIGSQPFSATTLPPIAPPATSTKDMVIAASRRQFSHPRIEVEEIIHKFHEPTIVEKAPRKDIPTGPMSSAPRRDQKDRVSAPRNPEPVRSSPVEEVVPAVAGPREQPAPVTPAPVAEVLPQAVVPTVEKKSAEEPQAPTRPKEQRLNTQNQQPRVQRQEPRSNYDVGPKRPEKKGNNLDDLRSVLKRIVDDEKVKEDKKTQVEVAKVEKAKEASRQDLRSTLSTVLAQPQLDAQPAVPAQAAPRSQQQELPPQPEPPIQVQPQPEPQREEAQPQPEPKVEQPVVVPIPPLQESAPVERHIPQPVPESPVEPARAPSLETSTKPDIQPTQKPSISPKELERMMRVNTSDTPPFK